jgi:hypothetical protein
MKTTPRTTGPAPRHRLATAALQLIALGYYLGLPAVQAANVTLSTASGSAFTTSAGASLPTGALVRIGSFSLTDAALASTTDYSQLNAAFKPLGEGIANAGTAAQLNGSGSQLIVNSYPAAGDVYGSIQNVRASYMAQGTQLYIWAFNASSPAAATQWGIFKSSTWQVPADLAAITLTTGGAVSAIQGSTASGQLRLATPAATLGNWTFQNFPAGAAASVTAYNADPDGDGISNLAEYAWKLSPTARSSTRASLATGAAAATFTFKAPRNLPSVAVTAECSSDLKTWSLATSSITASDEDFDTRTCTAAAGTGSCFWRVRFTSVP